MLCGNLPCLNKDAKFNVWECRAHLLLLIWVSQERDNMEISCRWQGYHRFRNISSCRTTKGFWIGQRYTARFEWIMRVMQAGLIYMEWIGKLLLIQHLCLQGLTSSSTMRRLVTISFQTVAVYQNYYLLGFYLAAFETTVLKSHFYSN